MTQQTFSKAAIKQLRKIFVNKWSVFRSTKNAFGYIAQLEYPSVNVRLSVSFRLVSDFF